MEAIKLYETARRELIALFIAKGKLFLVAQSRFPKSYNVLKSIQNMCHKDPACMMRFIADKSACACADRYGDDLFRKEVDGIQLPAVTHWFYGLSLPHEKQVFNRTKTFGVPELRAMSEVRQRARAFARCVAALPFVSAKEVSREEQKFEQHYAKAMKHVEKYSPTCAAYRGLVPKLPSALVVKVIAYV